MTSRQSAAVAVVIPVFDDWRSVNILIPEVIDAISQIDPRRIEFFIVNDGSISPCTLCIPQVASQSNPFSVHLVALTQNMGHQAAIISGLVQVEVSQRFSHVIVMDGDGEDTPEALRKLVIASQMHPESIVLAKRRKRVESFFFRSLYWIYKTLFRLLTGDRISYGNFSVLPTSVLSRILAKPEARLHFAATICSMKLPALEVETDRGRRYDSKSRMNFSKLILHGLSAIAIYADIVLVRTLILAISLVTLTAAGALVVIGIRLFTDLAIPGWATYVLGILLIIFVQAVALCFVSIFLSLNRKLMSVESSGSVQSKMIHEVKTLIQ